MEQFNQLKKEQSMEQAKWVMLLGITFFWLVNGLLTAVYGVVVPIRGFGWDALPQAQRIAVFFLSILTAAIVVLLTDGARYLWQKGRMAANSSKTQQYICLFMELASFGLSVWASIVTLRLVGYWLGMTSNVDQMADHNIMLTVFSIALVSHLVAAWFYTQFDPESKMIRAMSNGHARMMDTITDTLDLSFQKADADLKQEILDYLPQMATRNMRNSLTAAMDAFNNGDIQAKPKMARDLEEDGKITVLPHVKPANIKPKVNGVNSTQKERDTLRHAVNGARTYVNGSNGTGN